MKKDINLTAIYEPSPDGGYIGYIKEIDGVNTQGETLEETKENLADALHFMFQPFSLTLDNHNL
jgi:predicted RNase H-like HicB family nuclease